MVGCRRSIPVALVTIACLFHWSNAEPSARYHGALQKCGHSRKDRFQQHPLTVTSIMMGPAAIRHAITLRGGDVDSTPAVDFLNAVDLFGTGVFAFSGALTAGRKGMDLLGMAMIATITAVGGGTVRDVLLDTGPVFWMRQPVYLEISVAVTLATFLFWPILEERFGWKDSAWPICYADALCLGAFAVVGTQKAIDLGLAPILWIVCGLMTATFGGVTRDVICQQRPRVMYPYRTLYAPPPMLGSAVYALLFHKRDVSTQHATFLSIFMSFFARVLSFDNPRRLPHWKNASGS